MNEANQLGDLPEPIRRAVDKIRSEPAPAEAMTRALDRAAGITMNARRSWVPSRARLVAIAGLAAMVIVTLTVALTRPWGGGKDNDDKARHAWNGQVQDNTDSRPEDQKDKKPADLTPGDPKSDKDGHGDGKNKDDNYRIPRISEVPVPGKIDPDTSIGIFGGPAKPSETVAPPPGMERGQGGAGTGKESTAPGFIPGGFGSRTGSSPGGGGYGPTSSSGGGVAGAYTGGGSKNWDRLEPFQGLQLPRRPGAQNPDDALEEEKEGIRSKTDRGAQGERSFEKPPTLNHLGGGEKASEEKDKEKKGDAKPKDGKEEKAKKPQVWRRNGARPTFARVYLGDNNSLDLVSLQVTVTIEGPRARTVVDHIFHNPHNRALEGTFEYPLPSGASPSYFAMFVAQNRATPPPRFNAKGDPVALPQQAGAWMTPSELKHVVSSDWGNVQEARVVAKDKGLQVYEDIVRTRIDPALLEYAGGNMFTGRVFPIPANGYNRVLIVYEELLPMSGGPHSRSECSTVYRFPLPDCELKELEFRVQANAAECKDAKVAPKEVTKAEGTGGLFYSHTWKDKGPGGDAVFTFTPAQPVVQAISGRQSENGAMYLYARIRPELKVEQAEPFARQAVFLLDTSLSEHPDGFARNMQLMQKILESDADIKQFNVLTFNIGAAWVSPKGWLENTKEGREQLFKKLDGLVLEGATDFGAALNKLAKPSFEIQAGTALNVFVLSDGQITWGERETASMVARFEGQCPFVTRFHCYRTGLAADNLELFEALTRRGGGVFNVYNEADLKAAALAHRNQCLRIENVHFSGGPAASDVLIAGRKGAVYPGGELIVAAKMAKAGQTNLIVEGTFLGKKWVQEYPIMLDGYSDMAPRAWGEIAVASLLALNDPKFDGLVTAYSQQFSIGSRVASFLVLENEADYKRFNLEDERGKTLADDLGKFLDVTWKNLGNALSARDSFMQFWSRVETRIVMKGEQKDYVQKLLGLLKDADFEFPEAAIEGKLLLKSDVPAGYLGKRDANPRDVSPYLMEARRRGEVDDAAGAVRVLSSIIEMYPWRGDALRLVGYRLLDLKQPAQAANLFQQVQQQRPFEPHSYRDLARSLEESGKYALAALQYEIVLAGTWHNRFHESLKMVAREEYAHMMREAISKKGVGSELANHFGDRLEQMDSKQFQADLRVTISWNTDNTDVDLWVIEPDNTKCYYQNRVTKNGGELTEDMTQGYGPERFQAKKAMKGKYRVIVHYYRENPNLLAGETHVNVVVTRNAGTPEEKVERHTVILKKHNEEAAVCEVEY